MSQVKSSELALRPAVIGLVTPVVLSLISMAFWPERIGAPGVLVASSWRFASTAVVELLLIVTVGGWLWHRGWRPHRTATEPFSRRDVLRGLGVWLVAYLSYVIWAIVCGLIAPDLTLTALQTQYVGRPALPVILGLSGVNAIFEEFLWLGLGVAGLRGAGVRVEFAALISITLRVLVHVYQGPLALIGILPLAIVFTAYYVRTHRLWPVVVAHTFQDVLALTMIMLTASGRSAV